MKTVKKILLRRLEDALKMASVLPQHYLAIAGHPKIHLTSGWPSWLKLNKIFVTLAASGPYNMLHYRPARVCGQMVHEEMDPIYYFPVIFL
jgi:hypothetical protein